MSILDTVKDTATAFVHTISAHSPEILSATAIVGVISTAYLAAKATPEVQKRLEEKDYPETDDLRERGEIVIDQVKTVAPLYIPAAISGGLTIASIVGSNRISSKRIIAWETAYRLLSDRMVAYQEKAETKLGPKKSKEILEDIYRDHENRDDGTSNVIETGNGEYVFKDTLTNNKFKSSMSMIEMCKARANNELNKNSGNLSKNQWLNFLGLEDVVDGDDNGWTYERVRSFDPYVVWETQKNGEPIGYIHYPDLPEPFYQSWY